MSGLWASRSSRRRSVGDSTKDRRPGLKALAAASAQERRRQEFIANQKQARRNLADHARFLAAIPSEESDPTGQEYGAEEVSLQEALSCQGGCFEMAVEDQAQESATPANCNAEGSSNSTAGIDMDAGENGKSRSGRGRGAEKNKGNGKRGGKGHKSGASSHRTVSRRDHWANQLCTPEWMLTVPRDLNGAGSPVGAGWYVMARPEGKRVLLISAKGETIARQMSGAITHRFSSNLPGGSIAGRRGGTKGGGYCILDCVFHELDQTFFVLDMMAWKGYPMYDCNTDFRFYWVRTKLLEADGPLETVTPRNAFRLKPTPYHECDRQGLAHAYSSPVPFIKDGLLFHLKSAHYQLGPTPLVLLWKDATVARYLGVEGVQAVVLKVGELSVDEGEHPQGGETGSASAEHCNGSQVVAGTVTSFGSENEACSVMGMGDTHEDAAGYPLLTCDGVAVGVVGLEGSATYVAQAKPNELLRFTLTGAEEELVDQSEGRGGLTGTVLDLRFDKRCSKYRPMADSWSKVVFQSRLRRNGGISIGDIDANCSRARTTAESDGGLLPPSSSSTTHADASKESFQDEDDML